MVVVHLAQRTKILAGIWLNRARQSIKITAKSTVKIGPFLGGKTGIVNNFNGLNVTGLQKQNPFCNPFCYQNGR